MNQELIEKVLRQIDIDILQYADTTALETLLKSCPIEALKSYLPESE
jgi:7,8-dihydro-6-hydroxymethylpterin-pyrophosphokinase